MGKTHYWGKSGSEKTIVNEQDFLAEQLKTIQNLAQIGLLLRASKQDSLLPTILELLLVEAQQLVDDYCVLKAE